MGALEATLLTILPQLLKGAAVTLQVTIFAAILAFVLSFVVAFARAAPWAPLRVLTVAYVEVFRGTSAIVQLFYLFFILPSFGISLSAMTTAVLGLAMNFSAFGSEVVRSGLQSVPAGQREGAAALGLNRFQTYRLVIIPQAFVIMLPSFGNMLIDLIKASSLVSLITITDLTFAGRQMVVTTGHPFTVWGLVMLMYFIMAYPLTWLVRVAETRAARFREGRA